MSDSGICFWLAGMLYFLHNDVEALSEITDEHEYNLSDAERAVLEPALARAKRGEFASEVDVDEVLNKPWS